MMNILCEQCSYEMKGVPVDNEGHVFLYNCPCGVSKVIDWRITTVSEMEEHNAMVKEKFGL